MGRNECRLCRLYRRWLAANKLPDVDWDMLTTYTKLSPEQREWIRRWMIKLDMTRDYDPPSKDPSEDTCYPYRPTGPLSGRNPRLVYEAAKHHVG